MYAFIHDAPIDAARYARVIELVGPEPIEGLVVHLALAVPGGGLRYVDVWESREAHAAFGATRLGAAVGQMLHEHGIVVPEGEHPPTFEFDVVDVLLGTAAQSSAGLTAGAAARPS
jgi:hypothetical protein